MWMPPSSASAAPPRWGSPRISNGAARPGDDAGPSTLARTLRHHGRRIRLSATTIRGQAIYAPALLKAASARLPETSVVACDVGQHQMWVAQHMRFTSPRNHLPAPVSAPWGFGLLPPSAPRCRAPDDEVVLVSGTAPS